MKNIFALGALVCFAVLTGACRRNAHQAVTVPLNTDNVANRNGGATMTWVPAFSMCAGEPKDCGPNTVIVAKAPKLAALQNAVNNGAGAIGEFFSNTSNWDVFPDNYPSTSEMESLASGDYSIIIIAPGADATYHFLCGPTETLTSDNPEFVVRAVYED